MKPGKRRHARNARSSVSWWRRIAALAIIGPFVTWAAIRAAENWPLAIGIVLLVVLAVVGVWWWRSLDRLVAEYVVRGDRRSTGLASRPRSGSPDGAEVDRGDRPAAR